MIAMIAPLRRRHLRLTLLIAVLLPILYLAALVVRPSPPVSTPLPAPFTDAPAAGSEGTTP